MFNLLHLLGVALGAGGAYVSDALFLGAVRDGRLSAAELRRLRVASRFVWSGLLILIVSGLGLFFTDPAYYLDSAKFLAKMTIVALLALNGFIFHALHIPLLHRHVDLDLRHSREFRSWRPYLLASGALSFSSWTAALVLGAWRSVPYSYGEIMLAYLAIVGLAWLGAMLLAPRYLR